MEICKNMAAILLAYKKHTGKSYVECASTLELSPTTLRLYATGQGNPSAATIEHLAEKLGVDTSVLISGACSSSQLLVARKLLGLIESLGNVPQENRTEFAELFVRMIHLMSCGDRDESGA